MESTIIIVQDVVQRLTQDSLIVLCVVVPLAVVFAWWYAEKGD